MLKKMTNKMKAVIVCFFYILCVQLALAVTDQPYKSDSADFIFDYVNKARTGLKLTSNPNIILVTGITGGGKSTLTHYITGNYSKMISMEPIGSSSEYTIYDGLDPDVNETHTSTVSRTFVPELNIDEEKNVFYDCPGFADTRNETVEIATTFLIQSVIENARNIKIILVVNYESVTDGHDRRDFDSSLARLTELAQNVKRFENSITIVITKVPSYYIRGGEIVENLESSVKNSTAQFILNHRSFLQQKGAPGSEKKIQAIDALLKCTENGDYPRMSIFWRPMKAGPLDEIEKMVIGRRSIRNAVLKSLSYTTFQKNDIGFPLSAETKLKIVEIAQATIAQISSVSINVDRQLLSALQQKIQSIDNFHSKFDALELGLAAIRTHGNNEPETLKAWIDRLKTVIRVYEISSIDANQFKQIEQHEKNLNILKSISVDGMEIAAQIRDLIANSSTATGTIAIEHRWYLFLEHSFNFFINYEVQKDVSAYNVANLMDWGQINKPQGLAITAQTFGEFAKLLSIPIDGITPTEPRLKELNDIIGITLRSPALFACTDTMTITGNIGKSSDIQILKCPQAKKINVYVTGVFYVDADLNLAADVELNIYAPKWGVQRATTFNLNGGKFFRYANEMINGELLTILPNGTTGTLPDPNGMIAYKAILVDNMNNFAYKNLIGIVYKAIESNAQVNQAYTVSAYAAEAHSLEKKYFQSNELIDMYPLYRSLMERIDGYAMANGKTVPEIDGKILNLLYTTVFGKAANLRSAHKSDLIIDVLEYLNVAERNVTKLDDLGRIGVISALRDQYRDEIADKIKEAENYISNYVQPEIAAIFENLNVEMDGTVNEMILLQERTIKQIQRKQELVKKLREISVLQKIAGVVGMMANFWSDIIPFAGTVTKVINVAAGWVGDTVPELPEKNYFPNNFVFQMRKTNDDKIEAIDKQLSNLTAFVNDSDDVNKTAAVNEIGKKIADFAAKLSELKLNPTFGATQTILKDVLEFVSKPLAANQNASDPITKEFLKPFERAANILSVVSSSISTYKKCSMNDAKLDEIGNSIQQDRETIKSLMAFEDQISEKMLPLLDVMQINLKNVANNLTNKTLIALDIQKWKVAPTLRDIQKLFASILHDFSTEYKVANDLQRIQESMNLIVNIYDRIQNYNEETRFVNYMSELQSADYRNITVPDANLQNIATELRFYLHENILLAQYDRAVDGFIQAVFPFAADYLNISQLPKLIQPTTEDNMTTTIAPITQNLISMSGRIRELNNGVNNQNDTVISNAYFDRNDNGSHWPFYVWKNVEIHEQIEQLFAGKKVYLLADIAQSRIKLNAVKFKSIQLAFRSTQNDTNNNDNQTVNDDVRLNEILRSFHVSLTHMGESNYRCNNQLYAIYSRPLTIEYSFATRREIPTTRNAVYDKLNAVNPLLSPYTIWAVQLKKGPFDRLKEFANTVDIELHGLGQYVKESAQICNTNLDKYYRKMN